MVEPWLDTTFLGWLYTCLWAACAFHPNYGLWLPMTLETIMSKIDPTKVDIVQASFYWKNNEPGGLGFTFGPPMTPSELQQMFFSDIAKNFRIESDKQLGTGIVQTMLAQLEAVGLTPPRQRSMNQAILCALNIMWLSERGFIPNDEYNGTQYIGVK